MADLVNHPPHYNTSKIETIDIIKSIIENHQKPFEAYLVSNVVKYLCRYPYKGNGAQDLLKAKWYLEKLIKEVGGETSRDTGQL